MQNVLGLNVLIIYYGESNLEKASKIDNYYGFPNGIVGKDLYNNGILQAKNLGINVINNEVLNINFSEKVFHIKATPCGLNNNSLDYKNYNSKTLILATRK